MNQSHHLYKSHNVNLLLYHIIFLTLQQHLTGLGRCPAKYRKVIFTPEVETEIKEACKFIEETYEIVFLEIGADQDQVHFLVQSVPMYSPTKIVTTIKSITARWAFNQIKDLKKRLWGGKFWSSGYYICTVGKHGSESTIANYVRNQGKSGGEYRQLLVVQESLFGDQGS